MTIKYMKEGLMKNYTCAYCHNVYECGVTEEVAKKEAAEVFGDIPDDEMEIVCDDCYKEMIAIIPPSQLRGKHGEKG
jgi:rubredoxin